VAGDIGEDGVLRTYKLDGGTFEHGIVLFAHKSGVLDRFLDDIVHVLECGGCVSSENSMGKIKMAPTALVQMMPT